MKKLIYIVSTICLIVLIGCEDDKVRFPETTTGIAPKLEVNANKEVFNSSDRSNTAVEFTVDYDNYGGELEADTIFINVAKGDSIDATTTYASSKRVTYITNFPSTVTLTLVQICQALALDITKVVDNDSFELYFTLKTTDGRVYREGSNLNANVVSTITLGNYRYRFFVGCKTSVEEGYYKATLSGSNSFGVTGEKEVRITKQTVITEGSNAYLNYLRDVFMISDLSVGFYPKAKISQTLIGDQPVGIRDTCGTFILLNAALLTLPSPNPQVPFKINSGNWNASTKTLTLSWTDTKNQVTETTTFVKVRDL